MKKIVIPLLMGILIAGCAKSVKEERVYSLEGINLNRVMGIMGPYAPLMTDDGILFRVYVPEATFVTIAGSFNGWSDWTTPMTDDGTGVWSITVDLDEGKKYQYKYVVDGFWIADPDNTNATPDGYGGVNSIIDLR